jgi:hypothetical protein
MEWAKAIKLGRATDAEEWAMRQGIDIAERHCSELTWDQRSDLASEIAEALTGVRRMCNQGLM